MNCEYILWHKISWAIQKNILNKGILNLFFIINYSSNKNKEQIRLSFKVDSEHMKHIFPINGSNSHSILHNIISAKGVQFG